jgi:hypothetical protein
MDNTTFDLRSAALEYLHAHAAMCSAPELEYNAAIAVHREAREALFAAFELNGIDKHLLERLGLCL